MGLYSFSSVISSDTFGFTMIFGHFHFIVIANYRQNLGSIANYLFAVNMNYLAKWPKYHFSFALFPVIISL